MLLLFEIGIDASKADQISIFNGCEEYLVLPNQFAWTSTASGTITVLYAACRVIPSLRACNLCSVADYVSSMMIASFVSRQKNMRISGCLFAKSNACRIIKPSFGPT